MAVSNQTFYWAGSNRAMIAAGNSFPAGSTYGIGFSGPWGFNEYYLGGFPYNATGDVYWGRAENWFVKVMGSSGGTNEGGSAGYFDYADESDPDVWYWAPADRVPHRGDSVVFTHVERNDNRGLTFQMPLSPCLFGGRGSSGGVNMWIGDVFGGSITGNNNAIGGLASAIVEESYWNAGNTSGKIDSENGFRIWGMRSHLAGVSADNLDWQGINIKTDRLDIDGTWLRNPSTSGGTENFRTPNHVAWINDVEDCGTVRTGMLWFDIYGGTCNNFIFDDYHRSGATEWEDFDEAVVSSSFGVSRINLSVLETIRVTPKLFHTRVSWYDPSASTDHFVWGPQRVSRGSRFFYGTDRVTNIESYPHAGWGATLSAINISLNTQGYVDSGVLSGTEEPNFWEKLIVGGKEVTETGSTGNSRVVIDNLKMYQDNTLHDDVLNTTFNCSYTSNFVSGNLRNFDIQGFNNQVKIMSGCTISNIEINGGRLAVSGYHPGGVTHDGSSDDKSIRVDSVGRGPVGYLDGRYSEIDAEHPYFANYNYFIGGDPGSTSVEDGIQILDSAAKVKFAIGQYLKVAPTPYGSTAAFGKISGKPEVGFGTGYMPGPGLG